jgi:tripartite-type tricarboxylate transporter receptor subunit TctC
MNSLRPILLGVVFALACCRSLSVYAEDYPAKPITIVVPFAPGGVTDVVTRVLAEALTRQVGKRVMVENRAGGGGTIGTDRVAHASPDGYTLLMMLDSNTIAPAVYPNLGSDPIRDFAPISMVAVGPHVIVAHPSFPPSTVRELIDYAKQHPDLPYASTGSGTAQHLGMEQLKLMAGVDLQHIPYKGGGQAITDLVGGQVKVAILGLAPVLSFLRGGALKAIAVTGEKRSPVLPDVPTAAESGLPGFSTAQWFGAAAPAGTPQPTVARLHDEFVKAAKDPTVVDRLVSVGLEVKTSSQPEDFARFLREDVRKWPPIVKAAGVKVD